MFGHEVIGVEDSPVKINLINEGKSPIEVKDNRRAVRVCRLSTQIVAPSNHILRHPGRRCDTVSGQRPLVAILEHWRKVLLDIRSTLSVSRTLPARIIT